MKEDDVDALRRSDEQGEEEDGDRCTSDQDALVHSCPVHPREGDLRAAKSTEEEEEDKTDKVWHVLLDLRGVDQDSKASAHGDNTE